MPIEINATFAQCSLDCGRKSARLVDLAVAGATEVRGGHHDVRKNEPTHEASPRYEGPEDRRAADLRDRGQGNGKISRTSESRKKTALTSGLVGVVCSCC